MYGLKKLSSFPVRKTLEYMAAPAAVASVLGGAYGLSKLRRKNTTRNYGSYSRDTYKNMDRILDTYSKNHAVEYIGNWPGMAGATNEGAVGIGLNTPDLETAIKDKGLRYHASVPVSLAAVSDAMTPRWYKNLKVPLNYAGYAGALLSMSRGNRLEGKAGLALASLPLAYSLIRNGVNSNRALKSLRLTGGKKDYRSGISEILPGYASGALVASIPLTAALAWKYARRLLK